MPLERLRFISVSKRIEIEITSLTGDVATWRAAGAKLPKGTLSAALVQGGAVVGNVYRADVENYMAFLCVARSVSKKEAATNPDAAKAMDKEWDKLEKQTAWVLDKVREWSEVSKEANSKNVRVHVGRVFGILVERFRTAQRPSRT